MLFLRMSFALIYRTLLLVTSLIVIQPCAAFANIAIENETTEVEFTTVADGTLFRSINRFPTKFVVDKFGYLTEESVKYFLVSSLAKDELPAFSDAECLRVKSIMAEKGAFTDQLFIIESICEMQSLCNISPDQCRKTAPQSFVLKGLKQNEEIGKLKLVSTFNSLLPIVYPNYMAGQPQLILPFAYVSYEFAGVKHRLSLMHKAPGKSILSYVKQFARNTGDQKIRNAIKQCYFDLGRAMANFYKRYSKRVKSGSLPKSITHGDLHPGNIFYAIDQRQVFLIDNASMARSVVNPKDCHTDITVLLLGWLQALPIPVRAAWTDITVSNFFDGFASTYPEKERKSIYKELRKCINYSRRCIESIPEQFAHWPALFEEQE